MEIDDKVFAEIGYKIFGPDWKCKGFQYKVGEIFEYKGEIKICKSGFHYWVTELSCLEYFFGSKLPKDSKMAKVVPLGRVERKGDKRVTDKILILEEIDIAKTIQKYNFGSNNFGVHNIGSGNSGCSNIGTQNTGSQNTGSYNKGSNNTGIVNTGIHNSGDYNCGSYNSGCKNIGFQNSGNNNIGDYNSGCGNIGLGNTGNYNYGHDNSGNFNFGNYNTGDFNIADYNSGFFNTESYMFVFNKPVPISEIKNNAGLCYLRNFAGQIYDYLIGKLCSTNDNVVDKIAFQEKFKELFKEKWQKVNLSNKELIKTIPNFDSKIFYEIFGVELK